MLPACEIRHTLRQTHTPCNAIVGFHASSAIERRRTTTCSPPSTARVNRLVIRNASNKILLGLRTNEPAKGSYFVPGGRILKNERLNNAFARILKAETSFMIQLPKSLHRVYEHFYETNFLNEPGFGTHYVVLAYGLRIGSASKLRIDAQHSEYVWWKSP